MERNSNRLRDAVDGAIGSWTRAARSARFAIAGVPDPSLPSKDAARVREALAACLVGRGGDVSARARAVALGSHYLQLNAAGRERFLHLLAEFNPPRNESERTPDPMLASPRIALLRQFNSLPKGVKFLVDLRADLLALPERDGELEALDADLRAILASWFDLGFLELRRITWDAPASLLEKLATYEAVHEVRTWIDLKNRLDDDRRCFAYFHPVMPDEPLIFVEVALVDEMTSRIANLLDHSAPLGDPHAASTAIFYSISNCQRGLSGISFGNALIKRVVAELTAEFRGLRTFATLSPVPRFRNWLESRLGAQTVADENSESLRALIARRGWHRDPELARALEAPLMHLCAYYLLEEHGRHRRAADPVAHFHLSNGARLEQLNWLADTSPRGLRESFGIMVNYQYVLEHIDENHEAYVGESRIVASPRVMQRAEPRPRTARRAAQ